LYFKRNDEKLYGQYRHQLYRNHPFIIALDSEHHSLLEHPLAQQLISRKWILYRPFFYFTFILIFLLLIFSTFYVLIIPAPNSKSLKNLSFSLDDKYLLTIRWIIIILAGLNFAKIILEILLYRGLRVLFAQLFGIISFVTSIIAFIPYEKSNNWQWPLAAFSTLCQWFNLAFILRSIPFIGNVIVMFLSIFSNFISLIFVILPLFIAFTIATNMIFYNHSAFLTIIFSIHKLSAMIIGEFGYETLFHSKPTFKISIFVFVPFLAIMTMVFMNLLLGITVGNIQNSMENARAKASKEKIFK